MISNRWFARVVLIGASVALAGMAPTAVAALSDLVLSVQAQNGRAEGVLEFYQHDGWWEGNTFYLSINEALPIYDASGNQIATFGPATATMYTDPEGGRSFPQVNLGFAMQAGGMPTSFLVQSALLSFGAMHNPDGKATVGVTVSDSNGDGAQLDGNGPNGNTYLAQYNGFVPGGVTFHEAISQVLVDPFDVTNADSDSGWLPILADVTNMSSQIAFVLSAGDLASGTSNWQLVPEPASMFLLAVVLAAARRRA